MLWVDFKDIYLDSVRTVKTAIQLYQHNEEDCIAVVAGKPGASMTRTSVVDLVGAVNEVVCR